jgi:hypothetical protein
MSQHWLFMQPLKQNFNAPKTCQKPHPKTPQKPHWIPMPKNPLKIPHAKTPQGYAKIFYDYFNKKPAKSP